MKILIIDDSNERSQQVITELKKTIETPIELDFAEYSSKGKQYIQNKQYDFLILDVVLPRRQGESPRFQEGTNLLKDILTRPKYKKPTEIIAITADSENLADFKENFDSNGIYLIDQRKQQQWLNSIINRVRYSCSRLISNEENDNQKTIITIHGIRTFGEWQQRLRRLIELETLHTSFKNYKYGYEAIITFIFPALREKKVEELYQKLETLGYKNDESIYIFAHSFGTYLVVKALEKCIDNDTHFTLKRLTLAGSMLQSNYDFSRIIKHFNCSIINECGTNDSVLLLSEALLPDAGMAGREGFQNNFENSKFLNRFYNFGHSGYFKGDQFMKSNWIPLISDKLEPSKIVDKNPNLLKYEIINPSIRAFGSFKKIVFSRFKSILLLTVITLYVLGGNISP